MSTDRRYLQWLAARDSRRRNCLTDTTRTRWRLAILIKSRSRLRSSSRVTRCCALPRMAPSRISSSSGSRQIFKSPEVSTMLARAAINLTSISASREEYLKRRVSLGRLRTSSISPSWESDVMTLKSPRRQRSTTCPGGPVGLRKAVTQTLVSSRATSGTAFCLDLVSSPRDFSLHDFLWDRFGARPHPREQALEIALPVWLRIKRNQDAGLLFQSEPPQRSQHPVFEHRVKRFSHRSDFLGQRHNLDYSGECCFRQTAVARSRQARAGGWGNQMKVLSVEYSLVVSKSIV